jgi:hypothetical protein
MPIIVAHGWIWIVVVVCVLAAVRLPDQSSPLSGSEARSRARLEVSDSDGDRRAETFSTNVPLPHKPDLLMAEARLMRASAL